MNLAAAAPEWLAWLLIALLAAAAIEDAVRLRISNFTSGAIVVAAIGAMLLVGPEWSLWQNLVVLIALLVVGTPAFAAGMMGGGDVKLLAAAGLWFDLQSALMMVMTVLIAGGLLALILLGLRLVRWKESTRQRIVVLKRGGGIPYGVAIAGGAMLAVNLARGWG